MSILGSDKVNFNYIILILVIMGIICAYSFRVIIKHVKYELNFKESLLYSFSILILTLFCLIDYRLIRVNIGWEISICITIYFLVLLLIYYIIRFIKLKKYIPFKTIIGYVLISVINLVILFNLLSKSTSNINGWDALGLYLIYIVVCVIYIAILLIFNFGILIFKSIKKNTIEYKNTNYKISKFSIINLFAIILLIELVFVIDDYNEYNHNKLIENQKKIVIEYLDKKYPNYEFVVIDTSETEVDCSFLFCKTPVFKNEILNKDFNKYFAINVKKEDLTVYEDEFRLLLEEENNNALENKVKEYLMHNYNVSLKYNIVENKLEDVTFVLSKNYLKEEIDFFVEEMKEIFMYIEKNFYDLDYVELDFVNGNPFYTGEYEKSKSKGTINENTFTNELWIMVDKEYIFVKKQ